MSWLKVDDGFWSHPKTSTLSDSAVALWVRAGSYSCQHLTDGHIPKAALRLLGKPAAAKELVACGLWETVPDGWQFHDWDDYQESSSVVRKRRDDARERQRRARDAKGDKPPSSRRMSRVTSDVTDSVTDGVTHSDGHTSVTEHRAAAVARDSRPVPDLSGTHVPDDNSPQVTRESAAPPPSSSEFADGTPIPAEPPTDPPPPAETPTHHPASVTVETGGKPRRPAPTDSWRTLVRTLIGDGWPRTHIDDIAIRAAKLASEGVQRRHIEAGIQRLPTIPNAIPAWLPRIVSDVKRDENATQPAPRRTPTAREQVHLEAELLKDNPDPAVLAYFTEPKAIQP